MNLIICEPSTDCTDPNINRWHCMRGHEGAEPNTCPLKICEKRGANRAAKLPEKGEN